jgi:hypothetical protein
MALKPEVSLGMGVATAAVVYGIYTQATPSIADIRVGEPHDENIAGAERAASWTAAVVVGGISLIARDPTIFILGGGMIVAMAWWTRHANAYHPLARTAMLTSGSTQVELTAVQDDYSDAASGY